MYLPGLDVCVSRKSAETADIMIFELVCVDGAPLPAFSAGSHIDVAVPGGLVRQYSLCNDPKERDRYVIGVLKEVAGRGGSRAMHEVVCEGDTLRISVPKNHFALADGTSPILLLAGGIGVTPILCMAERLAAIGAQFEMHYCARSSTRMAFRKRIEDSAFADRVRFYFDEGGASQKLDIPTLFGADDGGTHVYVCGPKGFMDVALSAARQAGWAEERLHYEFFSGEAVPVAGDTAFEVELASSGRVIAVPANQTVVQALAGAGVSVRISCGQGVCGSCLTRVLNGEVERRDMFLTIAEQAANDQFTPCCSRAKSARLVLDL